MFHKRNSLGGRKVSPPQPTCMTVEQKCKSCLPLLVHADMPPRSPPFESKYSHTFSATYLDSLRSYRPARPTGSRPPPFAPKNYGSLTTETSFIPSDSAPVVGSPQREHGQNDTLVEDVQPQPMQNPLVYTSSTASIKGRPLAQPPGTDGPVVRGRKVSPTATVQVQQAVEDGVYIESVSRQMEKEEAHNLREALELIDHKDDENRIYRAAQDEAANLVWEHRNPQAAESEKIAAYRNPDLPTTGKRRASGHRQVSGSRKVSFPNPESQIYAEPQGIEDHHQKPVKPPKSELPLRAKSGNALPWLRRKVPEKSPSIAVTDSQHSDRFKPSNHPAIPSRAAEYTANTPPRAMTIDVIEEVDTPKSSAVTLEIRGDDIRAATSMKRKDRSPNLPTPTAVSDQSGRPIVSFDPSWRPPSDSPKTSQDVDRSAVELKASPTTTRLTARPLPKPISDKESSYRPGSAVPVLSVSAPVVPTINLPVETPEIPFINIEPAEGQSSAIPKINLPGEISGPPRPTPKHAATAPAASMNHKAPSSRLPWLHRNSQPAVSCSNCALPISGRIVTASGSSSNSLKARFHPECFTCHHCTTALECVSFYPEPEEKRLIRLESLGIEHDSPVAANDPLRFYCHLDFHEFFSPRCRSCKTPIEGEVVVAAGAEWHVGHFFCAECGDPFESTTPFVERDNYAYCVSCHTKRTSARCRECKQQILDELTVEALGGKYHEQCFACYECGGGFGDDGRFFVRDVDVNPTEKETRRGITRKLEEKAVCGPCEERRLKA